MVDENNEEINKLLKEKYNIFIEWQNDLTSQSKKEQSKYLKSKALRYSVKYREVGEKTRQIKSSNLLTAITSKSYSAL